MKNIAIVIDSSAGLSAEEAREKGWFFLPLLIHFDDKKFQDGIDLNSENLFDHFTIDSGSAKTSATPIGFAEQEFEKLSNEYKHVLVFPISAHLSSQYSMLANLASDYPNIRVIHSVYIASLIPVMIKIFEDLITRGKSFEEAASYIEKWNDSWKVTLMPKYNDYLVKGGRLHPAAATLAKLLQIVPMIAFENGELIREGKGRTFNKTVYRAIDEKFEGQNIDQYDCIFLHSGNKELSTYVSYFEEKYGKKAYIQTLPNVIAIHTGPEAIVVIKSPKLTEKQKELFE
ncbi:DegV family protein [Mycoplasmopsis gallopavonis]|uniref:Fatty acid-binding protein DegV-like protein n=1 Tax=Mycoplasmopsis gallopavonis TaxID=76629 RepID=A0A449AYJ2_9BACT|nr:DegV family protein [Mycoplasmopsis gallopavonis]RIV16741.1 DegV family EDD domain-containing protein [Mycoplasmopsis gallopavonis]VEU72571.1 Fatty acid-binding protein DegV-like protein [Mycoplasmopsis gallopavonis]